METIKKCTNNSTHLGGTYLIQCLVNGHFYVGSVNDFIKRKSFHKCALSDGTHFNKALQADYNKFGATNKKGDYNFAFVILKKCDAKERIEFEQKLLDKHFGTEECYNAKSIAIQPYKKKKIASRVVNLISPSGKFIRTINGLQEFCEAEHLDDGGFRALLRGDIKQLKGWTIKKAA